MLSSPPAKSENGAGLAAKEINVHAPAPGSRQLSPCGALGTPDTGAVGGYGARSGIPAKDRLHQPISREEPIMTVHRPYRRTRRSIFGRCLALATAAVLANSG